MTTSAYANILKHVAVPLGYSEADIVAGIEYHCRKHRIAHPPGVFDKAGRFEASERTSAVCSARTPSRAWPYSEMNAARTAAHCAEVHGAVPLHARRLERAVAVLRGLDLTDSAHGALEAADILAPILKRVTKRQAAS